MENTVHKVLAAAQLEPQLIDEILKIGRLKKVREDVQVISPGSTSDEIPIVLEGLLKVMRQDDSGNEIILYYLEGGQTCAMSITCCLKGKVNQFKAVAEEESLLWMIPMSYMDSWMTKYRNFRKFIFNSYQDRFDELLDMIDSVTFMKMDERLYKYLLDQKQATGSFVISKTHSQIARELNTSRVVVSRLLKQLERSEKIEQYRNRIEIL
jgi:CRP/FNR family transcriptional regulator